MRKVSHSLLSLVLSLALLVGMAGACGGIAAWGAGDEPDYLVIDTCDTTDKFYSGAQVDAGERRQGKGSLRFGGTNTLTISNSRTFAVDAPEDVQDWYLELWFYVDNTNNISWSSCTLELNASSTSYYRWKMQKLSISSGWNKIQVKLSNANEKKNTDSFTQIDRLVITLSAARQVAVRLDDICLSRSAQATDLSALQAAVDAAAAFETAGGSAANIARFASAKTRAEDALSGGCSQREAEVSAEMLNDAMNAFGFEGFTEDESVSYGYVDFSSMQYYLMDGFQVADGDLLTYADRSTAGFAEELRINAAQKYATGCADLRFTFTYYDGENGGLELRYGSTAGEKTALSLTFNGDNRWKTATVRVEDAALSRSVDGYDLALRTTGGTAYVSRVEVKVITDDDLAESDPPAFAEQTATNNIIGAGSIGYQMWFSAGDNGWVHWGEGSHPNPAPGNGNYSFDVYPYVQDYIDNGATLSLSDMGPLGNGQQSLLFTSKDPAVVETHFQWISEYGIDCMAVQRFGFGKSGAKIADESNHLLTVKEMAEKYDKTFYVMYDVSGQGHLDTNAFYERITNDWVLNVEQSGVASSTAYAHADGKPVVCIWGISGDSEQTNYPKGDTASRAVRWFQQRGYYVIIGTPDNAYTTRTGEYLEPFTLADMISPWTVGRYNYGSCSSWINNNVPKDRAFCEKYDVDYQPVIFPGFSWAGMLHGGRPNAYPRMAGEFVWRQARLYQLLGSEAFYFAMFDEYDEGTAYMKGASDYFEIPTAQYFVTYAADGQWLSNDYYLRTAQKAIQLLKGETTDTTLDIAYSQGPVYWRNSFEKRWTTYIEEVGGSDWSGDTESPDIEHTVLMNVDVCAPLNSIMTGDVDVVIDSKVYTGESDYVSVENDTNKDQYGTSREGTGIFRDASGAYTKSGEWAYQFTGTGTSDRAKVRYFVAGTDIMVSAAGLELSYSLYAVNANGCRVFVDLVMEDGSLMSDLQPQISTARGKVGQWVDVSVSLPASLVGRHIAYVVVGYQGAAGAFDAYIDDVILQSPGSEKTMLQTSVATASGLESESAALKTAIENANSLLASGEATDKQYLAAMKAIDSVIRAEGVSTLVYGDVNGDGNIDTTDARLTLQYAAKRIKANQLNLSAADVNGDGGVDTTDARLILQYAAHRISGFSAGN